MKKLIFDAFLVIVVLISAIAILKTFVPKKEDTEVIVTVIPDKPRIDSLVIDIPKPKKEPKKSKTTDVIATIYNPVVGQTDSTPLLTADGSIIDTIKLRQGELRWIGLSEDLFRQNGGEYRFGDTVLITHENAKLRGLWVVHDVMHPKCVKTIDILQHKETGVFGKWKIKISKQNGK